MPAPVAADDEARSDRRVVIIALSVMVGLVLFGVGYGSLFAATNCRQLRPVEPALPVTATHADDARALLLDGGLAADALAAMEDLLGPLTSAVRLPLDAPIRIGPLETSGPESGPVLDGAGVLVTGDGVVRIGPDGDVVAGVVFRRAVTVVGDGGAVYALVVGNTLTGQVDAIRPFVVGGGDDGVGFRAGTCVDTSAVGSPLSFVHDARDGQLLGLRTDEDGSDAVLELRDPVRGRVWAPVVALPRAPAGLQGSRTSGAIGPDTVVMVRRIAEASEAGEAGEGAVRAFGRSDGLLRWELDGATVRAALPTDLAAEPGLRLEVASVDEALIHVTVWPDVAPDALLPLPTHGPLGVLQGAHERTVTLTIDLGTGDVVLVRPGPSGVGRDGPARAATLSALAALSLEVDDVLPSPRGMWLLLGRDLARFGG